MAEIGFIGKAAERIDWQPNVRAAAMTNVETAAAAPAAADLAAKIGPAYRLEMSGESREDNWSDQKTRDLKRMNQIECQTCKARRYQDVSNDAGVSFKTPTQLKPGSEAAAVSAHEQEHVGNEQAKAANEGRKVVSQNVSIFTSICPECGRAFVSGGLTKTTTADKQEAAKNQEQQTKQAEQAAS